MLYFGVFILLIKVKMPSIVDQDPHCFSTLLVNTCKELESLELIGLNWGKSVVQ